MSSTPKREGQIPVLALFSLEPGGPKEYVLGSNVAKSLGFNRGGLYAKYSHLTVKNISTQEKDHLVREGVISFKHPKIAVLPYNEVMEILRNHYPDRIIEFTTDYSKATVFDTPGEIVTAKPKDSPIKQPRKIARTDSPSTTPRSRSVKLSTGPSRGTPSDRTPSKDSLMDSVSDISKELLVQALSDDDGAASGTPISVTAKEPVVGQATLVLTSDQPGLLPWNLNQIHLAECCPHCSFSFGTAKGLAAHLLLEHFILPERGTMLLPY